MRLLTSTALSEAFLCLVQCKQSRQSRQGLIWPTSVLHFTIRCNHKGFHFTHSEEMTLWFDYIKKEDKTDSHGWFNCLKSRLEDQRRREEECRYRIYRPESPHNIEFLKFNILCGLLVWWLVITSSSSRQYLESVRWTLITIIRSNYYSCFSLVLT